MIDLRLGDCLEVMRGMPDASVDAVVTDPPAGIGFMGKEWDYHKGGRAAWVAWLSEVMAECLRIAKPGAHALVWALPRTSHWTGMAIEDAGWRIDDRIAHHHGQGFPKHKSKLKPATEDWWLCTKPGGERWLNVDGCRVGGNIEEMAGRSGVAARSNQIYGAGVRNPTDEIWEPNPTGRWPTNLVLTHHPECRPNGTKRVSSDGHFPKTRTPHTEGGGIYGSGYGLPVETAHGESYMGQGGTETVEAWKCVAGCPVAEMDRQSGERKAGVAVQRNGGGQRIGSGRCYSGHDGNLVRPDATYGDSGGASRFYPTFAWQADDFASFLYCPKASRRDRGEGNTHPTVKPIALMRWLARLITPEGGTVLDPFLGSGTTAVACGREGFGFIGIEKSPEYFATAERRIKAETEKHPLLAATLNG